MRKPLQVFLVASAVALAGLNNVACARLGFTVEQCKQKYGTPTSVNEQNMTMEWAVADAIFHCRFSRTQNGLICKSIVYKGLKNDATIKRAFEVNTEGSRWVTPVDQPEKLTDGALVWRRADGGRAMCMETQGEGPVSITLGFSSP